MPGVVVALVLLLIGPPAAALTAARMSPPRPRVVRVLLTEDPAKVLVNDAETAVAELAAAVRSAAAAADGASAADAITILPAKGGALPARALLPLLDALLRVGLPVQAVPGKSPAKQKLATDALDIAAWTAAAPAVADVCAAGALPPERSAAGWIGMLEVDLRGAVAATGAGSPPQLATFPRALLDGTAATLPGVAGPSATVAIALGDAPKIRDLFLLLAHLQGRGAHRVLFLLRGEADEPAGLLLALTEEGRRAGPLPQRAAPPAAAGAPAYRHMRILVEEALLAMRIAQRPDGSLPGDDVFTDAEGTALALMAFLSAGVRAGDGTQAGRAVVSMERWLLAWPPDPNARLPRRERAIVACAMLDAYASTRHPQLFGRAEEALAALLKESATDQELQDAVVTGFEAIGIARACEVGLPEADALREKVKALIEAAIDPETNLLATTHSSRSSTDYVALANALVLFGADAASQRIGILVTQGISELPAPESSLANEQRGFSAFFQARLALAGRGAHLEQFLERLKIALPATAPRDDIDFEAVGAEGTPASKAPPAPPAPWSGGGTIRSVARVALMTSAYTVPAQAAAPKR